MRCLTIGLFAIGLVGCGEDHKATPDAAVSIDGAPDAAPAPITVTVHKDGGPQTNVRVLFQNADSSLVLSTTTDSSGVATGTMAAGGFVTVVDPAGPPAGSASHKLMTTGDVQPGDHLVVNDTTHVQFAVHVTIPYNVDVSAANYVVTTACGNGGATQPVSVSNPTVDVTLTDCPATTDMLVFVRDSSGAIIHFFFAPNVAVTSQAAIDLTASTYSNPNTRTYEADNVPAGATASIVDNLVNARGGIQGFYVENLSGTTTRTGSTLIPVAAGVSYAPQVTVLDSTYPVDGYALWERGSYTDSYTTDVASRLLVWLPAVPTYDATAHTMSWTEVAAGGTPDISALELDSMRSTLTWKWTIIEPHTANSFAIPVLPADAMEYNPAAGEAQGIDLKLLKVPGGYAAIRQGAFATRVDGGLDGQVTILDVTNE